MPPIPDIAQLSDEELRDQLQEYGVNVGPIVSTTRLFYEKKLGKLIDSGGQPQQETEESEEEYEEEEDEVQINYRAPPPVSASPGRKTRAAAPPPPPDSPPRKARGAAPPPVQEVIQPRQRTQVTSTPIIQARRAVPTTPAGGARGSGAPRQNIGGDTTTKASSGGGIGMWIKLLFIVFVAALVYLVIVNMNPSAQNKIPSSLNDPGV